MCTALALLWRESLIFVMTVLICCIFVFRHKNCHFFVTYFGNGDSVQQTLSSFRAKKFEPKLFSSAWSSFSLRGLGYHLVKREYRLMYKFKIDEFRYFILPAKAILNWNFILFYAACWLHNGAKVFLSLMFEIPLIL